MLGTHSIPTLANCIVQESCFSGATITKKCISSKVIDCKCKLVLQSCACANKRIKMQGNDKPASFFLTILVLCIGVYLSNARHIIAKRNYSDQSVRGYLAERTCWWNEVCKEEFHSKFRCRCPRWSYCRSPGRYYDAHCSMTRTGYIWTQPETSLTLEIDK